MGTKKKINERLLKRLEALAGEKLTLGSFLKAIRRSEEMTQPEFALLFGNSKQVLCDIEKGRRNVSPKQTALYAKKLGYSEEQFLRLCLQDILSREEPVASVSIMGYQTLIWLG